MKTPMNQPLQLPQFHWPDIPNIESTVKMFHAHSKDSPTEMLIAVNAAGEICAWNDGKKHSVEVPKEAYGQFIIHSHPGNVGTPLSLEDLGVIAGSEGLGNMAVSADGAICWSRGATLSGMGGYRMIESVSESGAIIALADTLMSMNERAVAGCAHNWLCLYFLVVHGLLTDLNCLAGEHEDTRGYDLAVFEGMRFPRNFSLQKR